MTITPEQMIDWCEHKLKTFERESTNEHPDEIKIKSILAAAPTQEE